MLSFKKKKKLSTAGVIVKMKQQKIQFPATWAESKTKETFTMNRLIVTLFVVQSDECA
jgi:hypothetical protein